MNKTIGPLNPDVVDIFSDCASQEIFDQSREIIAILERFTFNILKKHKRHLVAIAKKLLKDETISLRQIKAIMPKSLENSLEVPVSCYSIDK